jgi:preprotein translocase SecE subunit
VKAPDKKRKPRIRKSAPTIRERAEAAQAKTEPNSKPIKRALARTTSPVKKLRLGDRKVVKILKIPFVYIKRALIWIVPKYFVNSWREIKLVHWPNRRETWRLTLAVFIFALVFGAMVAGVDRALDEIFKKLVLK